MSNPTHKQAEMPQNNPLLQGSIQQLGSTLHSALGVMTELLDDNFVLLDPSRRDMASSLFRSCFLALRNQSHMSLYAAIADNDLAVFPQLLDFRQLCDDLANAAAVLLESTGHKLIFRASAGEYNTTCDANLLETAILNVLTNAVAYSPASQPVELSLRCSRDSLILRLSDSGGRLPPEDCETVFSPGGKQLSSDLYASAGLGMFITQGILQLHGGTVLVTSEPGKRTSFTLTVPVNTGLAISLHTPPSSYNDRDMLLLLTELAPVLDKSVYISRFLD